MSTNNSNLLTCKCGKTYKTKQPYIKHMHKCQATSDNTDTTSTMECSTVERTLTVVTGLVCTGWSPRGAYL